MADDKRAHDELLLAALLRNPIKAVDSVLRTGAAVVPAAIDALRALPRIATAMEKLVPALQAAQSSLDRIDQLSTFVGQELPETQHQLEELRRQLAAVTGVNRTLNESIRILARGLGIVRAAARFAQTPAADAAANPGSPRTG
jgi:prefoldin subunit 5